MNELTAEAFQEWQRIPITEVINCVACEGLIVTSYHQQYIFIFNEAIETNIKLCDSCFEMIKKEEL